MKITDAMAQLHERAEAGDTVAIAMIVLAYRLGDTNEQLRCIDGVLTEIRNTIQERT